jgi:IS605 OrfB family transposase
MKFCKTAQIQLIGEKDKIKETVDRYVGAMNYISQFAKNNKIYSKNRLQKHIYYGIREFFGLRSQMTINALGDVASTYKGKHKKNRFKDKPVKFKSRSMRLNYPRDYSFKENNIISINSLYGRLKVPYKIGKRQKQYINSEEWELKSAVLTIRNDGIVFLNIAVETEIEKTSFLNKDGVIGIDLGINFLAVTTDTKENTDFYGGGRVKYQRWLYQKHRADAQSKGTKSSKRFLRRISRKERRLMTEQNHIISKTIIQNAVERFESPIIAMEDLKGIRKSKGSKKHNRMLSNWSYYQLQKFIEYKAIEKGIPVVYVDPKYTSQMCPKCRHKARENRNRILHQFKCQKCGYQTNDDRSASLNIRDRAVVPRYIRRTRAMCQLTP